MQLDTFTRQNLHIDAGYVVFGTARYTADAKFVARFKYQRVAARTFATFLIRNFTPAEYFARYNAGESPLAIVESKGYILPHIRKWLRDAGYPETSEGYKAWSAEQARRRSAPSTGIFQQV
jgi:hypothetical protein